MKRCMLPVGLVAALLMLSIPLLAQESSENLSKQAANPVADLISIPIQHNIDVGLGEYGRNRNLLNIQPVIPMAGGRIITRTIMPVVWQPDITDESGMHASGLSDITFTMFYARPVGSLTCGFGPVIDIPTGGSLRGSEKWNIGPSMVALAQPGDWTLGVLVNNVWSFAGNSDRANVSKGLLQYFIVRQLGNGWYVSSSPLITANWKAESGQKWVVPFGGGVGKVSFLGKLPVNMQMGAYVNAVKPDDGPDWQMRFQAQFLLPTSMFRGK
jgi:hypothetical protein